MRKNIFTILAVIVGLLFLVIHLNRKPSLYNDTLVYDLNLLPLFDCYNLRTDFLLNADAGGVWTIVSTPIGSTLTNNDIVGDNPCVDFEAFGCGQYQVMYTVSSENCTNCTASTTITVYKCCISGLAVCN